MKRVFLTEMCLPLRITVEEVGTPMQILVAATTMTLVEISV